MTRNRGTMTTHAHACLHTPHTAVRTNGVGGTYQNFVVDHMPEREEIVQGREVILKCGKVLGLDFPFKPIPSAERWCEYVLAS